MLIIRGVNVFPVADRGGAGRRAALRAVLCAGGDAPASSRRTGGAGRDAAARRCLQAKEARAALEAEAEHLVKVHIGVTCAVGSCRRARSSARRARPNASSTAGLRPEENGDHGHRRYQPLCPRRSLRRSLPAPDCPPMPRRHWLAAEPTRTADLSTDRHRYTASGSVRRRSSPRSRRSRGGTKPSRKRRRWCSPGRGRRASASSPSMPRRSTTRSPPAT